MMQKVHDISVINYLDDFASGDSPGQAKQSYKKLGEILQECGLEESIDEARPPSIQFGQRI